MKKYKLLFTVCLLVIVNLSFSQNLCKITYVANEGFIIETQNKKILTDAIFNKIDDRWCDSPTDSILNLIKNAKAPFNNVNIVTISHKHRDHFNQEVFVDFILNSPKTIVVCPKQVEEVLIKNKNYKKFKTQIIALTPNLYCDSNIIVNDVRIRVLRLEHSHYMIEDSITGKEYNKHKYTENLGFLFDINGTKIFHCGDTNPLNEKEYATFSLMNEEIDIAFIERLFFSKGKKSIEILNNYILPKQIILMHVNPDNIHLFLNHFKTTGNIKIFEHKMDSMILNFD